MFKKIEALSSQNHQDLRFTRVNSFAFAATAVNAPLSASEFFTAAHYYPIIFPNDGTSPLALFSLNQKGNVYVNESGSWKAPYIPAHIRRYPFILANKEKSNDNFVVCIDREAPHFATGQGEPMFTANGEPAEVTQKAIDFLKKLQEELKATQTVLEELEVQKVLIEKKIAIEKNGQKTAIGGFRCVDIKKLNTLDDTTLAKWARNGLMGLISAHVNSLANLKTLA